MQRAYRYQVLSNAKCDIRLLELLPGTSTDKFRGKLTAYTLQADLKYEALSYMWGDPSATESIVLGESSEEEELEIASNLQQALRHLRYEDRSRMLWIDAICIDQKNLNERSQQVGLMQRIYQTAERVVAWIDHDLDPESPGLKALLDLAGDESQSPNELERFEEDPDVWEPVVGFLQNPYWNRVWVQQELIVAANVQVVCRQIIIPLAAFAALQIQIQQRSLSLDSALLKTKWYTLFGKCGIGKSPVKALTEWRARFALRDLDYPASVLAQYNLGHLFPSPLEANSRGTLLHCLNAFRFLDATDARDRVYALLGIALDCAPDSIPANYEEPLASCFADVIGFVIEKYHVLEFLCHVHTPLENPPDVEKLPSWIPDWHSQKVHPEIFSVENCASGSLKALPSPVSACRSKLRVQGFCLDKIDHVDPVKDITAIEVTGFVGHILALSSIIRARRQDGSSEELVLQNTPIPDQLLLTICHRFEGLIQKLEDLQQIRRGMVILHKFAVFLDKAGLGDYPVFLLRDLEVFKELEQSERYFIFVVSWAIIGKCFVVTEKGYAGLILASPAQVQDEIWILFGCSMPVVLRREEDQDHYTFITPVSMSGFMKGEAVDGIPGDVKDGDRFGDYEVKTIELQ